MKSVGWMWLFEIHCIFISFQHLRNLQNLFSIWIVLFVVPFHRICFSLHSRHSYLKACKGSKLNCEPLWKNKEEGVGQKMNDTFPPHTLSPLLFFFSHPSPPLSIFCSPQVHAFACSLAWSPLLKNGKETSAMQARFVWTQSTEPLLQSMFLLMGYPL